MKVPFKTGLFCPCPTWTYLLQEQWADYELFSTRHTLDEAWYGKILTARAYIEEVPSDKPSNKGQRYCLETWAEATFFSIPLVYGELAHMLRQLAKEAYYSFYSHGLCKGILQDPFGNQVKLAPKEEQLLIHLMSHERSTKERLLTCIWGYGLELETHTLETHMSHLRQKIATYSSTPFDIVYDQGGYGLAEHGAN